MRRPSGYIALDRGIFDHPLFRRRPDWLVAWEWLIGQAAWKPEGRRCDHGVVHVERGQLAVTLRGLGKTWGWPKSNVDCFLKRLACEDMVALEKTRTRTRTSTRTLAHPVTIVTICNYEKFQAIAARAEKPGRDPGRDPGRGMQQSLALQGLPPLQPANHRTKDKLGVEKSGESGQVSNRTKPKHGAKGRGMVWFDYGTTEWDLYAADFRDMHGVEKLPESRFGGRGNWFVWLGEAARSPQQRRASGE